MQTVKAGVNKRPAHARDQIDKILHTIATLYCWMFLPSLLADFDRTLQFPLTRSSVITSSPDLNT